MADEAASNSRVTELAVAFADELNIRGQPVGGSTGQVLAKTSGTDFGSGWITVGGGTGDVVGPASAVNGAPALFSGTTGKLIGVGSTTGTGAIVAAISPTLVTPVLGAASATSINKLTITSPATGATLTVADGKTLTASNSLTFAGTDGSTLNVGTGGTLGTNAYTSTAYLPLAGGTLTGTLITLASASGGAGLNLPQGAAPTVPANGDLWTTASGLYVRIAGSTVGPLAAGGGGGSGDVVGPASSTSTEVALFNGTTGKLLMAGGPNTMTFGTLTTAVAGVDMTATYNNAAITFPGAIRLNVTDTASNAASLLMDLRTGGASKFSVSKNGTVVLDQTLTSSNGSLFGSQVGLNGGFNGYWISTQLQLPSTSGVSWSSTTNGNGTMDTRIRRAAAGSFTFDNNSTNTFTITAGASNLATFNGGITLGGVLTCTSAALTTPLLGTPTSGNLSNCTADGTTLVGFRSIPQNSQSTAYTAVLADSGKCIFHPSSDNNARTFTIPANASVAYPLGTALEFINRAATASTIAITSDTLTWSPTGGTGSRTLAQYGVATAQKIGTTEWIITGTGLT